MEAFLKNSSGFSSSEKQELLSNAKVYQDKLAVIADNYDVQSKAAKDNDEKMFSVEALVQAVSDEVEQHYNDEISRLEKLQQHIFVGYGLTAFLTLAFLVFLVRQFNTISQRLTEVSAYIRVSGEQNLVTASSLHQTSAKTSAAASEQAAAIQETVATLNEISAMVTKSVEARVPLRKRLS